MDHVLDCFQKSPLGGRSNTKPGDHGTLNTHNYWFIPFYHMWGLTWINIIEIAFGWGPGHIWVHITLWGSVSILLDFWRCLGMAFRHFLLGSRNFMVTVLGLVCEVALIEKNRKITTVGIGNTRISTDYAQKSLWTLVSTANDTPPCIYLLIITQLSTLRSWFNRCIWRVKECGFGGGSSLISTSTWQL